MPVKLPSAVDRVLRLFHVDFAPADRPPSAVSVVAATVLSIAGSLAADALLVTIGQAVFPSTRGYAHFQFPDYSKLTVIGVVIACLAWPVVTRISSAPRWLFLRMAVAVTLVLWLPDVYILALGAAAQGGRVPVPHAPGHRPGHLQLPRSHREDQAARGPSAPRPAGRSTPAAGGNRPHGDPGPPPFPGAGRREGALTRVRGPGWPPASW